MSQLEGLINFIINLSIKIPFQTFQLKKQITEMNRKAQINIADKLIC